MTMPRLSATLVMMLSLFTASPTHAQTSGTDSPTHLPEAIRQEHMVHVSPHLIVFDPTTKSATLEFSNIGSTQTDAEVAVQFGFTAWQNRDTALFTPNWSRERAHDTVIVNPTAKDRYLGAWLSGVPSHILLKPHETKRITLRIAPPSDLPNGEYFARIVTIVRPVFKNRGGEPQDTRTIYRLPVVGQGPPPIRDSVRVFYRQGPQTMGLKVIQAEAEIDTSRAAEAAGVGPNPLRILLHVHLTGTTHFEGYIGVYYISEDGMVTQLTARDGAAFAIHTDGVMRWSGETDGLAPGHYVAIIQFTESQDDFPPSQRIPMDPVKVEIPFDLQ
ncbi:MAG TPA: hypothetical protein VNU46_04850 [Gemmatimonadaceae bacterium]|nr:hypothetical protein [Gemmatimonadaceae bacterium]